MEYHRFTLDGSDALEAHLANTCDKVLAEVFALISADVVEGMLLGGGYGRGEGGVLKSPNGDQPYNDLEFYLLLHGNCRLNEKRYLTELLALGHRLSPDAGLDIEFKILSRHKLRKSPVTMGYYDLVTGHRRIWGPRYLLDGCDHHRLAQRIPLLEATRLLMNRCSGLLFAQTRLRARTFTPEDADFVGRNQAKAKLAFGDVILTTLGQYDASCRERARRLQNLNCGRQWPWLEDVRRHHQAGVAFKLHPHKDHCDPESFIGQQRELVALACSLWLWLESRRLGATFSDLSEYTASAIDKCPETSRSKNLLINLKTFGLAGILGRQAFRYPRERLLHALSVLLWTPESLKESRTRKLLRKNLCTRVEDYAGLMQSYTSLWRRFN